MTKNQRIQLERSPENLDIPSIDCDHIWPMAQESRLFSELLETVDSLLMGVSVKPDVIDSFRLQARERISHLLDYHNKKLMPTSLLFTRELAGLASLCTRLYRGVTVGNHFSKERKAECVSFILKFFVYFQYPIDLRDTEPNFDESFLPPPPAPIPRDRDNPDHRALQK
jgi:hypothetical protein